MPILKGRSPDLQALEKASDLVKRNIRPIVEVVPRGDDKDIKTTVERTVGQVKRYGLRDLVVAFDAAPLRVRFGESASMEALHLLDAELRTFDFSCRPVVRPEDDPRTLEGVRHMVGTHHLGVCLRVNEPYVYTLSDSRILLEQLDALGLAAEQADVVLDCGFIRDVHDTADRLSGPLRHLQEHPWCSVTIVAGSFPGPDFFANTPRRRVMSIPRLEAALWTRVSRRWPEVHYGDYGVDHPGPPSEGLRPDPNLRYTVDREWRFYRQPKDTGGRHRLFHRLCRDLLKSPDWPLEGSAFSWGDDRIASAAREDIGPGSGAEWKAYSVSHHLAVIVALLESEYVPQRAASPAGMSDGHGGTRT
ncbi:beta family protein [Streptosporangium sp. NPDC023615]|uniref:beta family protein n=1 Tax=Streptosporangium sp. NPDC023615 TaxID=3154794 RepID=UPI003449FA85